MHTKGHPKALCKRVTLPHSGGVAALMLAGLSISLTDGWLAEAATKPAPSRDVGYIERIVGDIKDIRIDRDGKSMQPAILLPVRVDDRVFLKHGSELYLQLGNRRVVIAEKDSPYRVPAVEAPPAFLTRLRSTLLSLGGKLTSQYVRSSVPVSTSSRGHEGPLSMPVVEDDVSRLGSHRMTIHLAWEGGTDPFDVQVLSGEGKRLATQESVHEWRLELPWPSGAVREGPVRIVVEDKTGQRVSKQITLVPVHSVPERVPRGDLPSTIHAVVAADQLIQTNRRQWGFEAYQDLAPLADSYEPARLLRDCLEAIPSCYQH